MMTNLESVFPVNDVFPNKIEQTFATARQKAEKKTSSNTTNTTKTNENTSSSKAEAGNDTSPLRAAKELSQADKIEVSKLAARDREVRAHEAAHKAAGGELTGPARYDYKQGPDGKRYAVSGEVSIDTSKVDGDPEATVQKANKIRAAALAPANPSAQDQAVASQASSMAAEARVELREESRLENEGQTERSETTQLNSDTTTSPKETAATETDSNNGDTTSGLPPVTAQGMAQSTAVDIKDFTANTEAAISRRPGILLDAFA